MAKILIAEDEPDIQMLVKLTVEHAGHICLTADDGQAAVEQAQKDRPDLIILDVNMPRLNGFDACRRIRADPLLAGVPVVFLSVRGALQEVAAGFDAGATEYLVKPFAPAQLLKVVSEVLARAPAGPETAPPEKVEAPEAAPAGPAPAAEAVPAVAPPAAGQNAASTPSAATAPDAAPTPPGPPPSKSTPGGAA